MATPAADLSIPSLLDSLSERDMVFLSEILRIEESFYRFGAMETEGERVMMELLLDQLELIIDQLSAEDEFLWRNIWRVMNWLHDTGDMAPSSEDEVARFRDLALDIAKLASDF